MSAFNGHILGPKKLRRLNAATGMNFDKASRPVTGWYVARTVHDGHCHHYEINYWTGAITEETGQVMHWTTCPKGSR